ncbi:MAG: ABC transporter permease, partial [Oscillospiraceae bacterium]|nr:ABC transporter permease [Oscillospiraceae bacterium]
MKLTTKLAYAQIKGNRARSAWTLVGIILATMMITAIFGFAESARLGVYNAVVAERGDWHLLLQPFFSEGEAAEIASDEAVGGYSIQSKANQDGSMFWGIHFRLAKPGGDYMAQLEQICARHGFDLYGAGNYYNVNEEVLSLEGHGDNRTAKQFYGIAAILAVIIIAVSAVVISNAFKVSAGERVRQFGLLKSAGATKRHIVQIVLKEGLILSAAGIPLGALAGLGLDAATLAGANQMISAVSPTAPAGFEFEFTAAPAVLAAAAAFAFAAVMLSSYFPARRAAKIAAIDAIRQAGEIKLKARPMRPMKLVNKLFGFEGELAAKSMRRSRRAYRATVVSLTAGVVLFIACGEFIYSFRKTLDTGFSDMSVTAQITCYSSDTDMAYERIRRLTERFEEYENAAVYFQGYNRINRRNLETSLPEDMLTDEFKSLFASFMNGINPERVNVEYVVADDATYNELISQANAKSGDAILLNRARLNYSNEIYEYTPFIFKETTLTVRDENGMEREVALAGEARDLPQRFLNGFSGVLILLPEMDAT